MALGVPTKKIRLGIIGSRAFDSYTLLDKTIKELPFYNDITEIVSGGAAGADRLGALFARDNQLKLTEFLPRWDKYGKKAGFMRNETIVQNSDVIVAFWDGVSKGTLNTINLTKKVHKHLYVVKYHEIAILEYFQQKKVLGY